MINCYVCNETAEGDIWDNPGWLHVTYVASLGRGPQNHAMMTKTVTGTFCSTDCLSASVGTELLKTANSVMDSGAKITKKIRENLARAVCPWCQADMKNLVSDGDEFMHDVGEGGEKEYERCLASFLHRGKDAVDDTGK